ncbi:zinc-binding dehydrogenase [Chloroflexota bacterium]
MKAAVLHGAGDIRVEEVPEPTVEPGGVVIKVESCGICGSDLHGYRHGGREGMRFGHEFSGDIVEIGEGVTDVEIGDRVVAMSGKGCGECYWCKQGDIVRCLKMSLLGYGFPGAFAEYVAVPSFHIGKYADKMPDSISYDEGATVEPLSVSLHAVNQVDPQPGDTVVVLGLGILGLCIIPILKSLGITQILVSGRRKKRLELASELGAKVVVEASKNDITPIVKELNNGKGADIVFDCAGGQNTFQQALSMVHRGGKIDIVGFYQEPFNWNPSFIAQNDISLIGCGLRFDLPGALELLKNGAVDTKPMITHRYPLDKVKEAFDIQVKAEDAIKVIVHP